MSYSEKNLKRTNSMNSKKNISFVDIATKHETIQKQSEFASKFADHWRNSIISEKLIKGIKIQD